MLKISYRLNAPSCIAEDVETDLIVIHLFSGHYYNMRGVTVRIWNAIVSGIPPQALMDSSNWSDAEKGSFAQFLTFLLEESLIVADSDRPKQAATNDIALEGEEAPFHVDVFTDMREMLRLDPIHDADNVLGWPHKAG